MKLSYTPKMEQLPTPTPTPNPNEKVQTTTEVLLELRNQREWERMREEYRRDVRGVPDATPDERALLLRQCDENFLRSHEK